MLCYIRLGLVLETNEVEGTVVCARRREDVWGSGGTAS